MTRRLIIRIQKLFPVFGSKGILITQKRKKHGNALKHGIARNCALSKVPFQSRIKLPNYDTRSGSFRTCSLDPTLVRNLVLRTDAVFTLFPLFSISRG